MGVSRPQRTYLFKDLYKDITIRNPKKEGFIIYRVKVGFRTTRVFVGKKQKQG